MQFIEAMEIEEWCAAHGIAFASRLRPEFLTLMLENAWDAFLAPVTGIDPPRILVEISHDGWIDMRSVAPIVFAAVDG